MQTEQILYTKIIIWAFERQESGFTWSELQEEFQLNNDQMPWVQKVFRSNMPSSDNLIDRLSYDPKNNPHHFTITSKGISAAIEYLNLREAERSGKRAEKIALTAMAVGVIVGIIQILVQVWPK